MTISGSRQDDDDSPNISPAETANLKEQETRTQIKDLVKNFHIDLPRKKSSQVGAIYARYSTKFQSSIVDQVRKILEYAVSHKIFVPEEFIFFDLGISGQKSNRPGLQALEAVIEEQKVTAALFFSTSRLYRKTYRSIEFVDRLVKEFQIRCVFVTNAIDTSDNENWQFILNIYSVIDEATAKMYVANIRSAHEGMFEALRVHGTIPLGYQGIPIPDTKNRKGNPVRLYAINPDEAEWVRQVFIWFVNDLVSINEIIRRLNQLPDVPLPPKATTGQWTRLAVETLLNNTRYRGDWAYGKTESVLLPSKDYVKQVPREEPLKRKQVEQLRIVSDAMFFHAQKRLVELKSKYGNRRPNSNSSHNNKILNGLIWCPEHERMLYSKGPQSRYMFCAECFRQEDEQRFLFTQFNVPNAHQILFDKLSALVAVDEQLVEKIVVQCRIAAAQWQVPNPEELDRLKKLRGNLLRSVRLLMRQNPTSDTEERELESALSEKKQQLAEVESQIATINAVSEKEIEIPSAEQVKTGLIDLSKILLTLVEGGSDEDRNQVHELIKLLTGGRVYLSQKGERKAQRGWLEGRFQTSLIAVLTEKFLGVSTGRTLPLQEVVIDFRKPEEDDEKMQRAWQFYNDGMMQIEIAKKLECSRSNITRLLKKASEFYGVPIEDGRKRRSQLLKKQVETPEYVVITERAAELWKKGGSYLKIAKECSCSDATAKKAIAYWYRSRGLEAPTVNSRRAEQVEKAKALLEDGISMLQIAKRLGTTMTSLRKWLKADFEANGERLLDGRTRRWQTSA